MSNETRRAIDYLVGALILRETQKDATPARRKRKRRDVPAARPEPPLSRDDVEPPTGGWPAGQFQPGAPAPKPRRTRKARNAEPPAQVDAPKGE